MKKYANRSIAILLTLVMLLAVVAWVPGAAVEANAAGGEPVNLITNGDFEARSTVPGWDLGTDSNVNLAHGDANTGELALRIVDGSASAESAAESVRVPIVVGREYKASVYVKGAAGAQITLRFYDSTDTVIDSVVAVTTAETTDWTLLSINKTAPAGAAKADILLSTTADCVGTVLFDDALLDQSVVPTSIVPNGDFENGTNGWTKGYGGTVSTEDKSATDTNKVLKVDSVMGSYTTLARKDLPATAGETYIVSYDYKLNLTQRQSYTVMVRLQFRDSADALIGSQQDFYGDRVNVQDWKQFTAETTAPAGTVTVDITLWIYSDNEGEVWVDSLALTPKASDSISNTSFEEIATVPNWTISGSGEKQMAVSAGDVNAGNGALYVNDNSVTPVNVLSDAVTVNSNWIGHEMLISYGVKGLGPKEPNGMVNSTTPSVFVNFYNENGQQLATSTRISGSGAYPHWSVRSKSGIVPEGAKTFRVWIAYGSTTIGDVLIDDVTVTMVCKHDTLTYTEDEPTSCKKPGKESAYCALCQQNIEREIPQLSHTPDEGVIKTPASCDQTGVKTYTCTICGEPEDQDYPANGHDLKAVAAKPATATENGNIAYWVCKVCGKYFADADENDEIYDKNSVFFTLDGSAPVPEESETPSDPVNPPKTGDNTALALVLAVMVIAGAVVVTTKAKFMTR